MVEPIDNLVGRVESVERKIDRLAESVDEAFVEQRRYTESAYEQLGARMDGGFGELAMDIARLDSTMDAGFRRFEAEFARVDTRFGRVETEFARVDARFGRVEAEFARLDAKIDESVAAIQRKLDLLIDRK